MTSSPKEYQDTPQPATKKTRVQLRHALIDVTFYVKPKVQALVVEHGPLAELLYIRLILVLSAATDGVARKSVAYAQGLGMGLTREQVDAILHYLKTEGMIDIAGDYMSQDRVCLDQEKLADKRQKEAERKAKWRQEHQDKDGTSTGQGRDDPVPSVSDPVSVTDTGSEDLRIEEIAKAHAKRLLPSGEDLRFSDGTGTVETAPLPAKRTRKPKLEPAAVVFPEKWGQQSRAGFERWKTYRESIKKPLSNLSYQAQIDKYRDQPRTFVALVDRAIENGWQGLNDRVSLEPPPLPGQHPPNPSKAPLNAHQQAAVNICTMKEAKKVSGV